MSFIRTIKKGDKIYYQEVENKWIDEKIVQKHIRHIGMDKESPVQIPFEMVQFGYIETRLSRMIYHRTNYLTTNYVWDTLFTHSVSSTLQTEWVS